MLEQFDRRASKSSLEKVRLLAKKSADFLTEYGEILVKLAKNNNGSHPPDLAKESFWQFIQSTRGTELMSMLSIGGKTWLGNFLTQTYIKLKPNLSCFPLTFRSGQPSPALWRHYENWWGSAKVQWLDQVSPRKDDVPDWHMKAMWLSKSFMTTYWQVMQPLCMNMSIINVELLIWKLTMLRNILVELYLVKSADLEAGMKSTTFQKIAQAGKQKVFLKSFTFIMTKLSLGHQVLASQGDLMKIRVILEAICPRTHAAGVVKKSPWTHLMVEAADHEIFRGHTLTPFCPINNMVVPKMKGLPDHYR